MFSSITQRSCRGVIQSQFVARSFRPPNFNLNLRTSPFHPPLSRHYTIFSPNIPNICEKWRLVSHTLKKEWMLAKSSLHSYELLIIGGGILLAADVTYYAWMVQYNKQQVKKTVKKGTQPQEKVSEDEFIPRLKVTEQLKKLFQPDEDHSRYHVICGGHGTGKSTLITRAAREVGKGVIYIDVPADFNKLGEEFAKAINFISKDDAMDSMLILQLSRKLFGDYNDDNGKVMIVFLLLETSRIFNPDFLL